MDNTIRGQNGKFLKWDDNSKEFSIPYLSKKKKYSYSLLNDFKLYASGSLADEDLIRNRLKARENYLNYLSFLSLWIEIKINGETNPIKIIFFKTPYTASERERTKFVSQAIEILDKLKDIKNTGEDK